MNKNKICEWENCELVPQQNEIETLIETWRDQGLDLLKKSYPNHHPDCLQRIFAERLKVEHHFLIGELLAKGLIEEKQNDEHRI